MHYRLLLFCLIFSLPACKDYMGNPYKTALSPRVVPVSNSDLRMEPALWWTGMQHNEVEILAQREDLASYTLELGAAKGIKLLKVEKGDSPNYLFITLQISEKALQQKVPLVFSKGTQIFTAEFPVYARNTMPKAQGINSRDVVYMLMPDRFANGDTSNDSIAGMLEKANRMDGESRHGGDLAGVRQHLDYLQDLGVTALWLNPELENDQPAASYHGYAVTNHYRVDRRFGTNEQYRELVSECHRRGMKMIRDVVTNHIGSNHYWMKDLPTKDWVNQWPTYTNTSFRAPTILDPYASEYDKKRFSDGWFDVEMPDLNQRNPHVAKYLIQQAIWWIEYAGLDGFRIDTYTYSDQDFMSKWCAAVRKEYPNIGMFGEIWEQGVVVQGFFADNQPMARAQFDSNLPGVIDFQLCFAIQEALTKGPGWQDGDARIYYTLAQDYFYEDPSKNLIILDNHDMKRFYSVVDEQIDKYKSGLAFLLTMRGIPQIYYATEILSTGTGVPSWATYRKDFPGGWPSDTINKFTAAGRTPLENEAFNYVRTLIRYRQATPALQTGKLMQFAPFDGLYTYFRYDQQKTVMVVLNTSNKDKVLETARFAERMNGFTRAKNVVTGENINDLSRLNLGKNACLVLELKG
ncbi:MAG: cyclomaltodextrinase C-terminal domain-containing protein [Saprospiraceae bacterium]|nr:cyclomaltodextrinase C-terminal domain-containing protein [Saprospiraceae bacterium]